MNALRLPDDFTPTSELGMELVAEVGGEGEWYVR